MAIDLPTPIEPQLYSGSPTEFRQQAAAESALSFGVYRIHALGEAKLSGDQQAAAIADAETLSDAVRGIAYAHYLAGYPATQLRYLLLGEDLYIATAAEAIQAVQGRAELARYFAPLVGNKNLSAADLEPARALAGIEADRRGISGQLRFAPADRGLTLELDETAVEPQAFGARFNIGNPGNRYFGREFVEAEARLTSGAIEWIGSQRRDLDGEGNYDERAITVSMVAPQGLFGFDGRSARYTLTTGGSGFDGQTRHLGLQWTTLPFADFSTRWLLTLRLDDSDDRLADASRQTLRDEQFSSLGLDLSRAQVWTDEGRNTQLQLALSVDAGRGSAHGEPMLNTADDSYLLLRPQLTLRRSISAWTGIIEFSAQYSAASLPQQQQFVLGGSRNLGAWFPGVAVGDSGVLTRAELAYGFNVSGVGLTPRLFAGIATWELNDHTAADTDETRWLANAGVELLIQASTWLEASLSAATPLPDSGGRNAAYDESRADAYFSLTLRY